MTTEIVKHPNRKQLSREEAQTLTERIRGNVQNLWELLAEAMEGGAWNALGYTYGAGWIVRKGRWLDAR